MRAAIAACACALLLGSVACVKQDASYKLSGVVIDESSTGIANANVSLVSHHLSTTTAPDGSYDFTLPNQRSGVVLTALAPS